MPKFPQPGGGGTSSHPVSNSKPTDLTEQKKRIKKKKKNDITEISTKGHEQIQTLSERDSKPKVLHVVLKHIFFQNVLYIHMVQKI